MNTLTLSKNLASSIGKPLDLSINNNRSTMLSVRWEAQRIKLSLHRIFLQAPWHVRKDLIHYLRREKRHVPATIKAFIEESVCDLDYSHLVSPHSLRTKGEVYNLTALFDKINMRYFDGELDLHITWFGTHRPKSLSRCSLGLYYDTIRLIKVHRLLDAEYVPQYVIEYIIYHEMVHAVCPAYIDDKGINRIHSPEFKELECQFIHYDRAMRWLKENKDNFFRKGSSYGRS